MSAHSRVGGGTAAAAATGTTRPQLTLLATAPYPLTAHQWPAATAPVTHTWSAHAASVSLDLVGQGAGGGGWWLVARAALRPRRQRSLLAAGQRGQHPGDHQ